HRLVQLGMSPGYAVALLILVQLVFGGLALFAGRDVLGMEWALGIAAVLGVLLVGACSRARVYRTPAVGLPGRVRLVLGAAAVGTVLVLAASAGAAYLIRGDVNQARLDV